jgi:hypothetical protein
VEKLMPEIKFTQHHSYCCEDCSLLVPYLPEQGDPDHQTCSNAIPGDARHSWIQIAGLDGLPPR